MNGSYATTRMSNRFPPLGRHPSLGRCARGPDEAQSLPRGYFGTRREDFLPAALLTRMARIKFLGCWRNECPANNAKGMLGNADRKLPPGVLMTRDRPRFVALVQVNVIHA